MQGGHRQILWEEVQVRNAVLALTLVSEQTKEDSKLGREAIAQQSAWKLSSWTKRIAHQNTLGTGAEPGLRPTQAELHNLSLSSHYDHWLGLLFIFLTFN